MGGCRCTYRNCTMRTDGITHMFHYPVFDKLRCHQWLTNAQKHEFLNLKVSQLKNRVVCQHHFKDEYFMNFRKDKLTFKAVPTLNGPFCDPPCQDNAITQDEIKVYPISLDDIETEYLSLHDKKANFSVKYGDFLTNSEVMDMHLVDVKGITNKKTENLIKDKLKGIKKEEQQCHVRLSDNLNTETLHKSITVNLLPNVVTNMVIHNQPQLNELTPGGYILLEPTTVNVEFEKNSQDPDDKTSINNNNNVLQICNQQDKTSHSENKSVPQESKIKILSQKKINEPVPLTGQFTPISPSLILRWPEKRNNTIKTNINTIVNEKEENKSSYYINILDNNKVNVSPSDKVANIDNKKHLNKSNIHTSQKMLKSTVNTISSNKSLLKPKVTQDRVAEIEEKRKFNMKLKDIIESCFDKTDEQNSVEKKNQISNSKNQQVGNFLSKQTELPSAHEYTIASLEARMKRMEDVLLKKIDQNTRRIVDLKNTIMTSEKKSACTQTTSNEESQKKHLYKEISKYLSANANSLIYEELFINKYAQSNSQIKPSPKKRRRR